MLRSYLDSSTVNQITIGSNGFPYVVYYFNSRFEIEKCVDPGCLSGSLSGDTGSMSDPPATSLSLAIGPEGGFTDEEMQEARESGLTPMSLGPRVLRTETAGPAAIAVLQAKAGGF